MNKNIIPVLLLFFLYINLFSQSDGKKPILKMSDGQVISHPVRIFVANTNITDEMQPVLTLIGLKKIKIISKGKPVYKDLFSPKTVAENQTVPLSVDENTITYTGTILLFDFSNFDLDFYETGIRVLPVISWISLNDSTKPRLQSVIREKEVYLGNPVGGRFWAFISIVMFFVVIILFKGRNNRTLDLIRVSEDEISLSLTQMLLWTLAVGGMVIAYGLMYLSVPDIPDTLIWLMGLSITASAAGHYQNYFLKAETQVPPALTAEGNNISYKPFSGIASLVSIKTGGVNRLSIAKAQQLFWTLITIALFIVKSTLEGRLWAVPEELVILMGLSQGSYLLRNQMEIVTSAKDKGGV